MVSTTGPRKPALPPLMMWPRAQAVLGALAVAWGVFLVWSGISPVDGAMMFIVGAFFAGIGLYRIVRRPI
jgi:hypothetical protein